MGILFDEFGYWGIEEFRDSGILGLMIVDWIDGFWMNGWKGQMSGKDRGRRSDVGCRERTELG